MSFGFYIRKQSEQREEPQAGGKAIIRTTIEAADLIEVSPVTFPAYPQTELAARSLTPDQLAAMEALDKPAAKPGISARTAWLINSWKLSQ
jgi:phage head maturation protease